MSFLALALIVVLLALAHLGQPAVAAVAAATDSVRKPVPPHDPRAPPHDPHADPATPLQSVCMSDGFCSSKISAAAKFAVLNYDGKNMNKADSFPSYGSGLISKIDVVNVCSAVDASTATGYLDLTIQLHRLNEAKTAEATCRVVKLRVTEAGLLAGILSGKGFSFGKVSLQPDSNPADKCQVVKHACQTVTLPQ